MNRIGPSDLDGDLTDLEILAEAAKRACANRRDKAEVAAFLADRDGKLLAIQASLRDRTYRSSPYRMFEVHEHGKVRLVADLPLCPDRIVHWAIALVLERPLNSKLIDQTYGSIPGRGTVAAVRQISDYMRDPRAVYALQMDVRKFFPSIDKEILKQKLRHAIKDTAGVLWVLDEIIDGYELPGIAIGNRVSPMFANLYLSEIDHRMREVHHVHYHVRFIDDTVILGYSKQWLHRIRDIYDEELKAIGLEMKSNWQIYPVGARGVRVLGYVIYADHILVKKDTKLRLKRACARILEDLDSVPYLSKHDRGTLASYNGILKWGDCHHLRAATIGLVENRLIEIEQGRDAERAIAWFYSEVLA